MIYLINPFKFARIPNIFFGAGMLKELYNLIPKYGKKVLIVTGASSLDKSGKWDEISENLEKLGINYFRIKIEGEPSPAIIDENSAKYKDENLDLIVGIGGGSVIDAGKAISAMILKEDRIKNYLEGVGNKTHDGVKIPYIAVPTTSGTGSEATKNAVISEVGPNGFKKSLRHDNFVPDAAIIDPELILSCPPKVSASCGLDAFTQLLEAFVSPAGSPMTDALAYSGMKHMKNNIVQVCGEKAHDINARAEIAYGALMSGIALANAGLGIVHGLASPIGGFFNIPHGVVCGTLLAEATKKNIEKLKEKGTDGFLLLKKHAEIGALLAGKSRVEDHEVIKYCTILVDTLEHWIKVLKIDKLSAYGITEKDIDKIVEKAGLKNNPVELSKEDIKEILLNRL
ncbi:MAG: iron-containing alcohol dehydrogenase [Promethearchaeota archaeon]